MDLSGFMNIGIMPFWLAYPFTVLVVMVIVNAVNAFDGFDGFLSLYAILCMICFGLCFYDSENMVYCLIAASMVGALIVFFFHSVFGSHTGKSKIEMGNSGSLTLGFSLENQSYLAHLPKDNANSILVPYEPSRHTLTYRRVGDIYLKPLQQFSQIFCVLY